MQKPCSLAVVPSLCKALYSSLSPAFPVGELWNEFLS